MTIELWLNLKILSKEKKNIVRPKVIVILSTGNMPYAGMLEKVTADHDPKGLGEMSIGSDVTKREISCWS